jgi:glycosyltransferase involved in cell wall biosynthesis
MFKKGVVEAVAVADSGLVPEVVFRFLDYISPWTSPTEEHTTLRRLIVSARNCELHPAVASRQEVAELYSRAGAVLVPSVRPEGLGLVPLEAQASTIPTVTSALGGLREANLFPELLADPRRPEDLASKVRKALSLPGSARQELRAIIREKYGRSSSTDSLLKVFDHD